MHLFRTPQDSRFYDLFTDAAANIVTGVELLRDLVEAAPEDRPPIAERMRATEHTGDDITHDIVELLDRSFVTPFDREDIYRLAVRVDDVLDYVEAAADLAVLYRVDTLPSGVDAQVDLLCQAAELTADTMPRLRDLSGLVSFWARINTIEDDADRVYRRLLAWLFSGEFDPLTVMKLKEIVDLLESAADGFEHVGDVLHSMAVKEA